MISINGFMTNHPIVTHNCGAVHLVVFNFEGCCDSALAIKGPDTGKEIVAGLKLNTGLSTLATPVVF